MFVQSYRFEIMTYTLTAAVAFALWQQGWFFAAVVVLTLGGGLAMARPTIQQRQLCLRGTPVFLMFAVMLVSASGMVFVVDGVADLLAPEVVAAPECAYAKTAADQPCEICYAD